MSSPCQTKTKTTCPYCGVGCGVVVTAGSDNALAVSGDTEHPANFGRLCSKGAALAETLGPSNRLLTPSLNGTDISWETATRTIADKFSETIQKHGPDAVAFYVSGQILTEDYYVANKLMKGFIGSANIDTNSRLCMASSVAGHKRAFGSDTVPGNYEDLELADLLVLVGSNLAWCHPVLFQRIKAAKEARPDMKIVLIDPRKTMTAEIADLHLPIALDGDVALFNGLLKHLVDNEALDRDYIAAHTEGFADLVENVASLTPEILARKTGLETPDLERFYALFASCAKAVTVFSQGVNQSRSGTDKVNAIINCHLATGRIGKPGAGPFSVTGQPNAMGGREVGGLANMLAAHMDLDNAVHRDRVQEFWRSPAIADKVGLKAVDMFEAVRAGKIKAIWIMATNPVDSLPAASLVEEALEICPFVVVSEIYDNTDTLKYADVVLPSLGWGEKDGTVTNSERRISRQRAFLPAPGSAKADWWQMAAVARAMGFADGFDFANAAAVFREHAALSAHGNANERSFDIGACADLSDQNYEDLNPFQWPWRRGEAPAIKRFFAKGDFQTPASKGRFVTAAADGAEITQLDPDILQLNTGRVRDHWHTMTRTGRTARLSSHLAEPFCEISPTDAKHRSIHDADLVQVSNDLGDVMVRALVTTRVRPGNVFVPIHWTDQFASNARIDKLVPQVTDPHSGQPASKNTAVRVRKVEMASYAYVLLRDRPANLNTDYWVISPVVGGWQLECASKRPVTDLNAFLADFGISADLGDQIDYGDVNSGDLRRAVFTGNQLAAFVKLSAEPTQVSRSWAIAQLSEDFSEKRDRFKIISGRPAKGMPDKGPIICSCFSVGSLEISAAVQKGCCSVSDIGNALKAGTNCGSCKSEIKTLIEQESILVANVRPSKVRSL